MPRVELALGVEHRVGLLRRRPGVEVDQPVPAAHGARQDREVGCDPLEVEQAGQRRVHSGHAQAAAFTYGVVAVGLELVRELGAALGDDAAVDEHVDEVGLDVAQDARVVRDEQDAHVAAARDAVDALGDDLERVDVEAGVGLVEDRDLRLQQLHLQDLVALLLAAGEALVDAALGERRGPSTSASIAVRISLTQVRSFGASPRTAVTDVRRKFDTETPGTSTGYCMARNSPARARSSTRHREHVLAVEGDRAAR